ncbi:MAG: molybdopterin biosynthesis protein [Nannocystaceae bacterium]
MSRERPTGQRVFLKVVDPEEARRRWWAALAPGPRGRERVALEALRGRVLAEAIAAPLDVPGFDRANVDGYAVQAADTYGASEASPRRLALVDEVIATGVAPTTTLTPGRAAAIATGGVIPRGADAVVMIEDTDLDGDPPTHVVIRRPAIPGAMIAFVGGDITRGEIVLRPPLRLGPRETGVIAALGQDAAEVFVRPRIAVLSTGDEIVPPGAPRPLGKVHDCNQVMIADACEELGAEALRMGVVADDEAALAAALERALHQLRADMILLSGGTSKGAGDLSVRALEALPGARPGAPVIVAHGVALRPGKPLCLAATARDEGEGRATIVPIAVLPGFPTSALFTFQEFVAPVVRALVGEDARARPRLRARLPQAIHSERGRRDYVLVQLMADDEGEAPIALPMGKGSGSVTAFARADGFIAVDAEVERVDPDEPVWVERAPGAEGAWDLLVVGSHCTGLERIADRLHAEGIRVRPIALGSQGGLQAAERGHCDVAPCHLYDPESGAYNRPFVPAGARLVPGYGRMQGLLCRPDDPRFADDAAFECPEGQVLEDLSFRLPPAIWGEDTIMVNRNRGSGTRALVDRLLAASPEGGGRRPRGYFHEARSHQGVAACVAHGRADWGVAIESVARGLRFRPIVAERYDFVIPGPRLQRPAVRRFLAALADPELRAALRGDGFLVDEGLDLTPFA